MRIEPGSEPASGSVSPKQPIASPVHRGQPALFLLLGTPPPDREHRERALDGDRAADARVARFELQAGETVGDCARAGEAVAVEVHPEEAELAELRDQLAREDALLEPVADLGQHAFADELADGVANRPLLVVEECVETEEVQRVEGGLRAGDSHPAILEKGDLCVESTQALRPSRRFSRSQAVGLRRQEHLC
ncbi:MAG: hypothetical protein WKF41_15755 [Gaiellaceae bacterium]